MFENMIFQKNVSLFQEMKINEIFTYFLSTISKSALFSYPTKSHLNVMKKKNKTI